jgi:hypothetical protein
MDKELQAALADGRPVKVRPLARALSMSPNAIYEGIKRGEVESVRIGRTVRIPNSVARRLTGYADPEAA